MRQGLRPTAAVVALCVLSVAGCEDLLLSKETRRRIEAIKSAVRRDPAAVDAPDEEGQPPLHRAVSDNYYSLQEWLLDRGASPNGRNAKGETALHVAVSADHTKDRRTIRLLLRRGANPKLGREDGTTPLHVAAAYGTFPTLDALLEGGADPRARTYQDDTPLHLAAAPQPDRTPEDCRLFVEELVAWGGDPNARNVFGMAPLHRAAMVGHLPVVRALLDAGARVDLVGTGGATALHLAAVSGHAPVVAELLARGADRRRRDDDGRTALESARARPAMFYDSRGSRPVDVAAVIALLSQ